MLTAVATVSVTAEDVSVVFDAAVPQVEEGEEEVTENEIIPIAPELKEIVWGFTPFIVLALLMRYVLYPRLRKGMDARYRKIKSGHDEADRITEAARSDVAKYETQLAAVRSEAQQRIDAARQTLDAERSERLAEVNARIAERRAAAATQVEAARAAAEDDVATAVRAVATRAGELALGRQPDGRVVSAVVSDVMGAGVSR